LLLLAAGAAFGQDGGREPGCNVVSRSAPDVNEQGRIEQPPPTSEECEAAAALEAKFLATSRGEFRLVRNLGRLPEPVLLYIGGIPGLSDPRTTGSIQTGGGRYSRQSDLAIWLSPELVVIAYRGSDISGAVTNVVLADLGSLDACTYLRWRGGDLPGALSIAEIQAGLGDGLLGDGETPACHLQALPLD
jgi:hypothetical protein